FDADEIRNKKADVLRALRPIPPEQVPQFAVRGQYGPGQIDGKQVSGYRQESSVSPQSNTETFAALKLHIDNWRWQGVPFYLRSGKAMSCRTSQIVIQFRPPPIMMFNEGARTQHEPNKLIIQIQPDEGIQLHFQTKVPDAGMSLSTANLDFRFAREFTGTMPDAYQ